MKAAYFNTVNADKVRELKHFFGPEERIGVLRLQVTEILDVDLDKVVRAKAAAAYAAARMPVIVEHGALCVDFLNGLPGALVKPMWEALGPRICELVPEGKPRTVTARSALCYCDGRERLVIVREVEGELATSARGSGGFHWDPVFIPQGETRTFAEMPLDEKLKRSPAARCFEALREKLKERGVW
jgi:XTP/dITP diphosphohydrolase